MNTPLKHIAVVAAAIVKEGRILATQRGYGEWQGWWEFPGGKLESGETMQQALERELSEELCLQVEVNGLVGSVEYDYPKFHLSMSLFRCTPLSNLQLNEHSALCWLDMENLRSVRWLPADLELLPEIEKLLATPAQ